MKKFLSLVVMFVAATLLFTSCGISQNLTSNTNVNQTNVVLSKKNFHVVKTVSAEVEATYVLGIGGLSKKALRNNAVAELTKKANLTGSQALVNVTVKQSASMFYVFYQKMTCYAEGTVIEFDE